MHMEAKPFRVDENLHDFKPSGAIITRSGRDVPRRVTYRAAVVALAVFTVLALWFKRDSYLHAIYRGHRTATKPIGTVEWVACKSTAPLGTQCGYVAAPLDYFDTSAGSARIALARYPATAYPRKGMVLINPGGPGVPGYAVVQLAGDILQSLFGEEYDVVGFDSRGIGETTPSTRCFQKSNYSEFRRNTVLELSYDIASNMSIEESRLLLVQNEKQAQALLKTQFEVCNQSMGEQLRYMGTSTVVRDIDFLSKVLEGEDALINFWGGSYGTVVGQYLVNMLPDRVGRVVIDGVVDVVDWTSKPYYTWYKTWLSSTEKVYDIFVTRCGELGPDICALAREVGESGVVIKARIERFIDELYYRPLPVPKARTPGLLTAGIARMYLFEALQIPAGWVTYAQTLADAMNGDGTALVNERLVGRATELQRSAVSCNDNRPIPAPAPETVVDVLLDVYQNVSRSAFAIVTAEPDAGCQYWLAPPPPERFEGPWNHTLKTPMLVISNTADPVTPISSGRLIQELMGDSVRLLVQDSPGHSSLAFPTKCTLNAIRAYYANGTLPDRGTVCPLDNLPFYRPDPSTLSRQEVRAWYEQSRLAQIWYEARTGRLNDLADITVEA